MEPDWSLTAARFKRATCRAAALSNAKTLAMRKCITGAATPDEGANLFFPDEGLFGCEVALGWVLRPTVQAPAAHEGPDG